jgi:hypothetical protein
MTPIAAQRHELQPEQNAVEVCRQHQNLKRSQ